MLSIEERSNSINKLEQKLHLQFLDTPISVNLCFVNDNDEIRNEFKQSFTEIDFLNFLKNFQNKNIELPDEPITFWGLVEKGKEI